MQAYRIVDWWRFELLKNGKLATAKTKMGALRIKSLVYVRFPIHGHNLSANYRRMVKRAGPEMAAACDGLYKMLAGLAGDQVREYRGWVLDDRQRPLDSGQIAELLCLSEEKTSQIFEILTDSEVNWVEFLDFPEALCKSLNSSDLSGKSQIKKSGNNWEKKGSALNEVEAKRFSKDKGFESEADRNRRGGVREKKGAVEPDGESGGGEENVQPQPQPAQPSVSGSGSDSVPASATEKPSDSVSDSDSVPDSVSQAGRAGAGAGVDGPVPLTGMERFNIYQERNDAEKKVMRILKVNLNNKSDTTTICDIYEQFANRLIRGDTTYPLFEHSLNTAHQCWRAKNQIAMFVSAMKEPPFSYDPVNRSVIPGKYSRDRR